MFNNIVFRIDDTFPYNIFIIMKCHRLVQMKLINFDVWKWIDRIFGMLFIYITCSLRTWENQRNCEISIRRRVECVSISSSLITFQTTVCSVSKRRKISIMAPAFWIMAFNNVSRVFHNSARLVPIREGSFRSADNSAMHHSLHISSIGQHRVLSFEKEWLEAYQRLCVP